jgi:hypothetical protein
MMNGKGKVLRPEHITIYYKRAPKGKPECMRDGVDVCRNIPRGLRMVFGRTMDGNFASNALESFPYFDCVGNAKKAYSLVELAKVCPMSSTNVRIAMIITAASCWDGVNLDSADHRSHVVYSQRNPSTGIKACPATHPYQLPGFKILASFNINPDFYADLNADGTWAGTYNGWHLSSDKMNKLMPGKSVHADWFGGWDDTVLKTWHDNCIDKLLSCSAGNLGNGTSLKSSTHQSWSLTAPFIVDPPPMPVMDMSTMSH